MIPSGHVHFEEPLGFCIHLPPDLISSWKCLCRALDGIVQLPEITDQSQEVEALGSFWPFVGHPYSVNGHWITPRTWVPDHRNWSPKCDPRFGIGICSTRLTWMAWGRQSSFLKVDALEIGCCYVGVRVGATEEPQKAGQKVWHIPAQRGFNPRPRPPARMGLGATAEKTMNGEVGKWKNLGRRSPYPSFGIRD